MARRRDTRVFGPGPYMLGLRRDGDGWGGGFPFELPAVAGIEEVRLDRPVTLLAGENTATRPRNGYFLRAESFFNVAQFIDSDDRFSPDLSIYGAVPLHQQSHGESFLALAANRFGAGGLYLLDEPEAALSVSGELALLAVIARAAAAGAQFVVATHSPILLACPNDRVYEFDGSGVASPNYDDLQAVSLARGFLAAPERYLMALDSDAIEEDG